MESVIFSDCAHTIANFIEESANNKRDWVDWIQAFSPLIMIAAVVLAHYLYVASEKRKLKKQMKEELIGALSATQMQFKRNNERLAEALDVGKKLNEKRNDPNLILYEFQPRLIMEILVANIGVISLRLTDKKLLYDIICTYEQHHYINRKWDQLSEFQRRIPTEYGQEQINLLNLYWQNMERNVEACEEVTKLTKDTIDLLEKKLEGISIEVKTSKTIK